MTYFLKWVIGRKLNPKAVDGFGMDPCVEMFSALWFCLLTDISNGKVADSVEVLAWNISWFELSIFYNPIEFFVKIDKDSVFLSCLIGEYINVVFLGPSSVFLLSIGYYAIENEESFRSSESDG